MTSAQGQQWVTKATFNVNTNQFREKKVRITL